MFVVKGESAESDKEKVVAVFQYEEAKKLTLVHHEKTKNGYPTFFKWGEEVLMIPTDDSEESKGKLIMFNTGKGQTFIETNNSIIRLHSFLKDKNNFVTATIGNNGPVLLFTQQKKVDSNSDKENVYLWMTDGTRVSCAGTIADKIGSTDTFYASLLYTDKKLFALHQTVKASQTPNKIELTLLKDQLDNITKTLDAWKESNDKIENLYKNTATPTTKINFSDGIVGFLSGTKDNITWEDGYLYANATVTPTGNKGNPTKEKNGFTFTGAGVGAKWPVGKNKNDQPYNFKDFGFTLLATVTVGSSSTSGEDNSVLGFGLTGGNKVGLWCTTNGEWRISSRIAQKNVQTPKIACKREKKYYVALTFNGNEFSAYINGKQLPKLNSDKIHITTENIDDFYFGADTPLANTDVSITNVLLYNRPFEESAIHHLKPEHDYTVDTEQHTQPIITDQQTSNEHTTKTESSSLNTSPTKDKEEEAVQSSSPPPTTEDSTVRVGVVGVLCFMLFGVFTLLGRYVY